VTVLELLDEAARRGIELYPDGNFVRYRGPKTAVADLKAKLAANKVKLLVHLRAKQEEAKIDRLVRADAEQEDTPADKALALLDRLRCYTLPSGSMAVVNQLADVLAPFARATEPAAILSALRDFEHELIALGGAPDPHVDEAFGMVERSFPGACLVEVKKLK
jgi:hypothetical protein